MELSGAVMDAIKNKTYNLKPVEKPAVKRKVRRENQDYNIGEILARRIAMGYGMDEDIRSARSIRFDLFSHNIQYPWVSFNVSGPMGPSEASHLKIFPVADPLVGYDADVRNKLTEKT